MTNNTVIQIRYFCNANQLYMKQFYSFIILFLLAFTSKAQVVINELDTDTESTDTEEFIELLTDTPEYSLDGLVLVLFNGSASGNDSSYFALDLDGLVSDVNGIVLIGNNGVSPVPDAILFDSTIQNGADAIAIYTGNATDWPDETQATTVHLIDALVYDTNDTDDTELLALLGETIQYNEGDNGATTENSIQLNNDGSYTTTQPTPGLLNDGSGILFNFVSASTSQEQYEEGIALDIVFTIAQAVTEQKTIDFTLINDTFTTDDYTGDTTITFESGSNSATVSIAITDDTENEGDEIMKITFGGLPNDFKRGNDNIEIRIVDNDYTTATWGTPLNPTFDLVESTQPDGYYDVIDGLAGDALVQGIQDIIANPDVVRSHTYADIIDILKEADQSPLNSNQVWLVYSEEQRSKLDFQSSGSSSVGLWNREHTYPRSRGSFDDIEEDDIADGIDVFVTTTADSLRQANSDAHGLRPADGPENSSRGNQDYGEYTGPTGNQGSFYGDVARNILFLTIRYNGLEVVAGDPDNSTVGVLGDLDLLLEWHRNDPPDDYEMNRNNVIYNWQVNRNPFIDMPDLVEFIWGTNVGDTWNNPLSVEDNELSQFELYPNPSTSTFMISTQNKGTLHIYDTTGRELFTQVFDGRTQVSHNLSAGLYLIQLSTENSSVVKRLIMK